MGPLCFGASNGRVQECHQIVSIEALCQVLQEKADKYSCICCLLSRNSIPTLLQDCTFSKGVIQKGQSNLCPQLVVRILFSRFNKQPQSHSGRSCIPLLVRYRSLNECAVNWSGKGTCILCKKCSSRVWKLKVLELFWTAGSRNRIESTQHKCVTEIY